MNKKYWLFLDGHAHCFIKKNEVLFYNTLNGRILRNTHVDILKLGKELSSEENLNVIQLDHVSIENTVISKFIADFRTAFMGDIIETTFSSEKPIQMMPLVKINRDIKYLKKHPMRSIGDFLMEYLSELNLFLNGDCKQNCTFCSYAYKQYSCCTKNEGAEISITDIKALLKEAHSCTLLNFNILGGNILKYTHLKELIEILNEFSATKKIHIHYQDFIKAKNLNLFQKSDFEIKLIVPPENNTEDIALALEIGKQYELNLSITFPIQSENDYHITEQKIHDLGLDNYIISPLYNGGNISFFEKNIFLDEQDISDSKPKSKDIYAREKINSNFFGKLSILSDGGIYANVNHKKLGKLGQDTLYDVLYMEMENGENWRKVRSKVKPCCDCTFEKLCPPISSYEYLMNRYNLCHINS